MAIPYLSPDETAVVRAALTPLPCIQISKKARFGEFSGLPTAIRRAILLSLEKHEGAALTYRVYSDIVAAKPEEYLLGINWVGDEVLLSPAAITPRLVELAEEHSKIMWSVSRDITISYVYIVMALFGIMGVMFGDAIPTPLFYIFCLLAAVGTIGLLWDFVYSPVRQHFRGAGIRKAIKRIAPPAELKPA